MTKFNSLYHDVKDYVSTSNEQQKVVIRGQRSIEIHDGSASLQTSNRFHTIDFGTNTNIELLGRRAAISKKFKKSAQKTVCFLILAGGFCLVASPFLSTALNSAAAGFDQAAILSRSSIEYIQSLYEAGDGQSLENFLAQISDHSGKLIAAGGALSATALMIITGSTKKVLGLLRCAPCSKNTPILPLHNYINAPIGPYNLGLIDQPEEPENCCTSLYDKAASIGIGMLDGTLSLTRWVIVKSVATPIQLSSFLFKKAALPFAKNSLSCIKTSFSITRSIVSATTNGAIELLGKIKDTVLPVPGHFAATIGHGTEFTARSISKFADGVAQLSAENPKMIGTMVAGTLIFGGLQALQGQTPQLDQNF